MKKFLANSPESNSNSVSSSVFLGVKRLLTNNIGMKLGSVLIAFLLWIVVVSVDDPLTTRSFYQVPVELINTQTLTSQKKVYELDEGSSTITVEVTAKRSVLDSLSRDNFKATADMSKMDGNLVPVEVKATRYADRIDGLKSRRQSLKVKVENLLENQFTIVAETPGEPAEGCVIGDVILDRTVVKVSGPESQVQNIEKACVSVNVSGMTGDMSTSEAIVLYDASGNEIPTGDLTLSWSSVNITVEIWGSKEVSITPHGYVGIPAEGFGASGVTSFSPDKVTIAGKKSTLSKITTIDIPAEKVNIEGASADVISEISLEDCLPDGIKLVGDQKTISAMIGILPFSSRTLYVPVANVTAVNVPEGYTVSIGGAQGDRLKVEIRGLGTEFESIHEDSLLGVVDIGTIPYTPEEVSEGHLYTCPVVFKVPDGVLISDSSSAIMNVVFHPAGETVSGDETQIDAQGADEDDQQDEEE